MDAELIGRINALEALVMTFAGIMIRHSFGDEADGTKVKALLQVVRSSAIGRARSSSEDVLSQTEEAIDELIRRLEANLLLLYSPRQPNA